MFKFFKSLFKKKSEETKSIQLETVVEYTEVDQLTELTQMLMYARSNGMKDYTCVNKFIKKSVETCGLVEVKDPDNVNGFSKNFHSIPVSPLIVTFCREFHSRHCTSGFSWLDHFVKDVASTK